MPRPSAGDQGQHVDVDPRRRLGLAGLGQQPDAAASQLVSPTRAGAPALARARSARRSATASGRRPPRPAPRRAAAVEDGRAAAQALELARQRAVDTSGSGGSAHARLGHRARRLVGLEGADDVAQPDRPGGAVAGPRATQRSSAARSRTAARRICQAEAAARGRRTARAAGRGARRAAGASRRAAPAGRSGRAGRRGTAGRPARRWRRARRPPGGRPAAGRRASRRPRRSPARCRARGPQRRSRAVARRVGVGAQRPARRPVGAASGAASAGAADAADAVMSVLLHRVGGRPRSDGEAVYAPPRDAVKAARSGGRRRPTGGVPASGRTRRANAPARGGEAPTPSGRRTAAGGMPRGAWHRDGRRFLVVPSLIGWPHAARRRARSVRFPRRHRDPAAGGAFARCACRAPRGRRPGVRPRSSALTPGRAVCQAARPARRRAPAARRDPAGLAAVGGGGVGDRGDRGHGLLVERVIERSGLRRPGLLGDEVCEHGRAPFRPPPRARAIVMDDIDGPGPCGPGRCESRVDAQRRRAARWR